MKIKEITAGLKMAIKEGDNFVSHSCSLTAELESGDTEYIVGAELLSKANNIITKRIDVSKKGNKSKTEVKTSEEKTLEKCEDCGTEKMAKSVIEYSRKNFGGKVYCFECQKKHKEK